MEQNIKKTYEDHMTLEDYVTLGAPIKENI